MYAVRECTLEMFVACNMKSRAFLAVRGRKKRRLNGCKRVIIKFREFGSQIFRSKI